MRPLLIALPLSLSLAFDPGGQALRSRAALPRPEGRAAESLEMRLVRSIALGVLQVDPAEALRHARAPETDFTGHVLARAALAVAGRDDGFPEWPLSRLLSRALDLLVAPAGGPAQRPGMPDGFGDAELVLTLVQAMVTAGQATAAVDVLEANLAGGGAYETAVVLQALRNVGDARSTGLIQRFVDAGDDRNLGENLLADLRFPFLDDLRQRLHLIPPEARTREALRAQAAETPGERSALAVYFLGFLPPGGPADERADLALLRRLTRSPHFMARYFATRSLALRSRESVGFWAEMLGAQDDPWQRAQTARIGFALHGRAFARAALGLLAAEPAQYAQWELMHGNLEVRRGNPFRTWWDVWLAPTLQFRLNFAGPGREMDGQDVDELLRWLERGARPRDGWVRNHLLHGLAGHARGPFTARYLRLFALHPERSRHYWILFNLPDPASLPTLRAWRAESIPEAAQRESLASLIERLERMLPPVPSPEPHPLQIR